MYIISIKLLTTPTTQTIKNSAKYCLEFILRALMLHVWYNSSDVRFEIYRFYIIRVGINLRIFRIFLKIILYNYWEIFAKIGKLNKLERILLQQRHWFDNEISNNYYNY